MDKNLDVLVLHPAIHSGEQVIRADRCQIKNFAGLGLWPPISLAQVTSVLLKSGFQVRILDSVALGLSIEETVDRVVEMSPAVVVIQNTTPTLQDDLDVAVQVRRRRPSIEFVYYGLHATARPNDILGECVRFVVRGEPEYTLVDLIGALTRGSPGTIRHIRGLSYWDGKIVHHNPDRELIPDLSELPYPAMEMLPLDRYVIPSQGERFWIVQVSRGCPFRCIFCTANPYYKNVWRMRSIPHVIGEIKQAVTHFSIRNFMFLTDTFNVKRDYVMKLCNSVINEGVDIRWVCNSRVDNFTQDMAMAMRRAGCWLISFGVESGSDAILKRAKKGATTSQAVEAIRTARGAGIKSLAYFMFGLPGETRKTMEETIRFAVKLDPDYAHFYMATPFPGTEFFDMAEKEQWLTSYRWERYFHGASDVISYPNLSAEEMQGAIRRAYKVFYRRPKVYLREIASIRSLKELNAKAKTALQLLLSNISR